MNRTEIENKVKKVIINQFNVEKENLTGNTDFVNDLNADSLDSIEVIMNIEDEFEISIPDSDEAEMPTIKDVVDYIENKL